MIKIWYRRDPGNINDYREFETIFDLKYWIELCSDLGDEITIIKGEQDGKEFDGIMLEAFLKDLEEMFKSEDFWKNNSYICKEG